jgi:YidC/Oxa1 family membrane protein insertase
VEKRLVIFLLCSMLILTGHVLVTRMLFPPPPVAQRPEVPPDPEGVEDPAQPADQDGEVPKAEASPEAEDGVRADSEAPDPLPAEPVERADVAVPPQWVTLGSFAPESADRLLVTFTNRGAAIERVELVERRANGQLRYRDLSRRHGYLGLQCHDDVSDGRPVCRVSVVGPGTPAALARPRDGVWPAGLLPGDVIERVNEVAVSGAAEFESLLEGTRPGQAITLSVRRDALEAGKMADFDALLEHRPLELVQLESLPGVRSIPSYLLALQRLGSWEMPRGEEELQAFASLRTAFWRVEQPDDREVAFHTRVRGVVAGASAELEVVKRFRIGHSDAEDHQSLGFEPYHLDMRIEWINHGGQPETIAYFLDGPNGLPKEGWWYSNKIHSSKWGAAGARDVIWRVSENRHSLRSASQIHAQALKTPDNPLTSVLTSNPTLPQRTLDYLGVDTQYFAAVTLAGDMREPTSFVSQQAYAMPVGPFAQLDSRAIRTLNTTYRYESPPLSIDPGGRQTDQYHVFLGPKSPALLDAYGLSEIIEYGWFGWIAKPLSKLLHFFYGIVHNYGLAIVLLTVLVRGAMFPIGRKAARNAQIMQELAPEIKKIKEKYKNDLEKQGQAQRELWKKHNFNPLGGCWLMFLQLPIFIGLYRSLSVDIELRQAPLIPGINWCSNLAGPDMAWRWQGILPDFLAAETGWLGPYLNILPIVTIVLFIVQQKMFTPPATDDQTRMQQKMMTYMMVFMGFLFFKVPAGLCVYFIASSIWGIAERKLLPKPTGGGAAGGKAASEPSRPEADGEKSLLRRWVENKQRPESPEQVRARRKQRRR